MTIERVDVRVKWLEDEVLPEWEVMEPDRWTNVRGAIFDRFVIDMMDKVFSYSPQGSSPLLRVLSSNYTQIERRKCTRRERLRGWWFRRRLALAEWISPYDDHDDDDGGVW